MACFPQEFYERAAQAVKAMSAQPIEVTTIEREVNEFFGRYPGLIRTKFAEAFITALVIDKFSDAAPAAQTAPKTGAA